ncbi:MAG: hypothetical protein AAB110_08720 [Candidatus Desantisbacteria bacterium]
MLDDRQDVCPTMGESRAVSHAPSLGREVWRLFVNGEPVFAYNQTKQSAAIDCDH